VRAAIPFTRGEDRRRNPWGAGLVPARRSRR
jgi:hypothetical protein